MTFRMSYQSHDGNNKKKEKINKNRCGSFPTVFNRVFIRQIKKNHKQI